MYEDLCKTPGSCPGIISTSSPQILLPPLSHVGPRRPPFPPASVPCPCSLPCTLSLPFKSLEATPFLGAFPDTLPCTFIAPFPVAMVSCTGLQGGSEHSVTPRGGRVAEAPVVRNGGMVVPWAPDAGQIPHFQGRVSASFHGPPPPAPVTGLGTATFRCFSGERSPLGSLL